MARTDGRRELRPMHSPIHTRRLKLRCFEQTRRGRPLVLDFGLGMTDYIVVHAPQVTSRAEDGSMQLLHKGAVRP